MNVARIKEAAKTIEHYEAALKWLMEWGDRLSEKGAATVRVDLHDAGSLPGASNAEEVLSAYASLSLHGVILPMAIQSCRNTIAMEKDAIRLEIESDK